MGPPRRRLFVVHAASGAGDRLPLPRRAGRALGRRLLHQLHRHGGGMAAHCDRGLGRLERGHADGRPRPELSSSASWMAPGIYRGPRRARGASRVDRRVPSPAVEVGDGQLPIGIQAPRARAAQPQPGRGQAASNRPFARLWHRPPDAPAADVLPGSPAHARPARSPMAACRRIGAGRRGRRVALVRVHRRSDPARTAMVVRPSIAALPGCRRRDVADRDGGHVSRHKAWRTVHSHTEASDRAARPGVARPGLRPRGRPPRGGGGALRPGRVRNRPPRRNDAPVVARGVREHVRSRFSHARLA